MSRADLELVRNWASAKLAGYQGPIGARQSYTKVRNPMAAGLAGMKSSMRPPNVSKEEHEVPTEQLCANIGRIVVLGEHLNVAMSSCCAQVLEVKGLPKNYAQIVLIGRHLEIIRRTWESLLKVHYAGDTDEIDLIDHLSKRLDDIIRRRNDVLHRLWLIEWRDKETEGYDVERSIKDVEDCEEIIAEMLQLTSLVNRFRSCVVLAVFQPGFARPANHFHYENGVLLEGAPRSLLHKEAPKRGL